MVLELLLKLLLEQMRKKLEIVVIWFVSLLTLVTIAGWMNGLSPGRSVRWVLEELGFQRVEWLVIGLNWLHQPGREATSLTACLIAGFLASGSALHRGPLRRGVGAVWAWALIVPAAEVLGLSASLMYALAPFGSVLLIAALCTYKSKDDQWSATGTFDSLSENLAYFLLVPLLVPYMSGWLLAAYRGDRGMSAGDDRIAG